MLEHTRSFGGHPDLPGSEQWSNQTPEYLADIAKRQKMKTFQPAEVAKVERMPVAGTYSLDEYRILRGMMNQSNRPMPADFTKTANDSLERLRERLQQEYRNTHPKESAAIDFDRELGNFDALVRAETNKQLDALVTPSPSLDDMEGAYLKIRTRVADWFDRISAASNKPKSNVKPRH